MSTTFRLTYTSILSLVAIGCGDNYEQMMPMPDSPPKVECQLNSEPPIKFGASIPLTGNGPSWASPGDQPDLLKKVINEGCGAIGTELLGTPIDFIVLDSQDSQLVSPGNIDQMVSQGVVALSGSGSTVTTAAAILQDLFMGNNGQGYGLPFMNAHGAGSNMIYCTAAQLADPNVTKSTQPTSTAGTCFDSKGLVYRTRDNSISFGSASAIYVNQIAAPASQIALYSRTEPSGAYEIAANIAPRLQTSGHTVNWVTHTAGTPTVAQFKDVIIPAMVANNPTIYIAGAANPQLANFMEGFAQYAADPNTNKPSNFTTAKLVFYGNVAGGDFTTLSLAARTLMLTRLTSIQPHFDERREGYKRWHKLWTDFYPSESVPLSPMQNMFFDGWMIMTLAMVKANSTSPEAVKANYLSVVNPPGTIYYPDQYKEARAALLRGEDIDYDGASVGDMTPNLENAASIVFGYYTFDIDGVTTLSGTVEAQYTPPD